MKGNVIVGQSGGPTAAINSSLAGVYRTAKDRGANKVYGMLFGIQGLLQERYIDLSEYITNDLDTELLKRTPAAFLGSCRYKLPEIHENKDVYEKIFSILEKLDIEAFIYIGGNDSMDTIKKLSDYAIVTGYRTRFIGCPKTIDNDLALTDHTPGYGSAAKYIGTSVKEIIRDSFCLEYGKGLVSIVEIMGRNAGWLTGAAALAKGEDCLGPDLIYLPELPFDIEAFSEKVKDLLAKKPSVVVAVSEGIRLADGRYVCELGQSVDFVDAFGHKQLSGTANYLASYIAGEFARRIGTKEEEAFLTGDGKNKPTGVFPSAELGVTANGASITFDDVIDLYHSLRIPYRRKAVWLLNDATIKALRKIKDNNGNYIWQPSVTAGTPDTILNRPCYSTAFAPELAAGNRPMLFGDFSYYWIADREYRSFKRLNELYAANGQIGFLASQRVDGMLMLKEAVKALEMKAKG